MADKTGVSTAGLPQGPDIPAGQTQRLPGLESAMQPLPEPTAVPTVTTSGDRDDDLQLREYTGADKLHSKVALITGGDSGIGRAIAIMYAREGADIAIVYLPQEEGDAQQTAAEVERAGRRCLTLPLDISEEANCVQAVRSTVEQLDRLDILVNNAATQEMGTLGDTSFQKLDRHFKTNVYAQFVLAREAVPHIPRGGSIINCTSLVAYQGYAPLLEYSSTKGAIVAFTRSLSQALADKGIRVNGVAPGPVWTPLNPASRDEQSMESFLTKTPPLGRLAQPSEIGPSFVFLAAGESSAMTGQVLHPNGGFVVNG